MTERETRTGLELSNGAEILYPSAECRLAAACIQGIGSVR
jgi:hypothetical protein